MRFYLKVAIVFLLYLADRTYAKWVQQDKERLFRDYPLVIAHDAATTYIDLPSALREVQDWAQTQEKGSFENLLECGARAFDIRLQVDKKGQVVMHHGKVTIETVFAEALEEVVNWSNQHEDELVVLLIGDFIGEHAKERAIALMRDKHGIHTFEDCVDVGSWTLAQALNYSKTSSKARILSLSNCINSQYDPSIECARVSADREAPYSESSFPFEFVCYGPPKRHPEVPLQKFDSYMDKATASSGACASNSLWMAQAHWQYSTSSVAAGVLLRSSILEDSSRSKLNEKVATNLKLKRYSCLNFLELDAVCSDGGKEVTQLVNAIQTESRASLAL